jgi:hypothetical protein
VRLVDPKSGSMDSRDEDGSASGLYPALMAHVLHQDRLIWDIAQLVIALQAGVLASSYAAREHWLGPAILLLGAGVTLVLLALVVKCEMDRDVNRELMDMLGSRFIPTEVRAELLRLGRREPLVRISATPPRWYRFVRGRYIVRAVLVFVTALDLALALVLCSSAANLLALD